MIICPWCKKSFVPAENSCSHSCEACQNKAAASRLATIFKILGWKKS